MYNYKPSSKSWSLEFPWYYREQQTEISDLLVVHSRHFSTDIVICMTQWVLHHWDEKQCLKVLKNCYEALPDQGKVIVVDMVIPETPATTGDDKSLFQLYSFLMNTNPKRKERTEREFERLAKDAGFSGIQVACCAYNFSVVEFYKNM